MNMNKNTVTDQFKITVTEKGLKCNKSVPLSTITNTTLKGLLSVFVAMTNEDNREALYAQLSTAFSNCLAHYAPDLYFPDEEELLEEEKQLAIAAQEYPDITEQIEQIKADVKTHIKDEDAFQPGETAKFDDTGKALFD